MIPNYLSSASPSPFAVDPSEDHDHHHDHQVFVPNYQTASSSSVFFPSNQDQREYYPTEMQRQLHQREAENHAPHIGSHELEKKTNTGLRLSLWKNNENQADQENRVNKWMSSKVKLMHKMKKSDLKEVTGSSMMKLEDQKQPTTSIETDHFSSNSSNTPIRVCADCNTTKTPLWRSGPKGPKSLCNACGIRQRKARRAMAAAAAAANGTTPSYETTSSLKIKVQNKEKIKNNGHSAQFKKRCKPTSESSSPQTHAQKKKNGFEDFLCNLSKSLAFHRVFPQDEKEAAILLMALSCGLVHG